MRHKFLCLLFASLIPLHSFAQVSVSELLANYLENSLEIQDSTLSVVSKSLSLKGRKIENTVSVQLSSGTVQVRTSEKGSVVSFSPSASVTVPMMNNFTFKVSSNMEAASSSSVKTSKDGIKNTSLSVSADLYSSARENAKISVLKAEREFLEARRNLSNAFLSQEKEFYTELKSLYSIASNIASEKNKLYSNKLDFEEVQVQGYATTSVKYRQAKMKVLDSQHNVEKYEHELNRSTAVFASKCGIDFEGDAMAFLPDTVPASEPVDVLSFDKKNYVQIESATWTNYVNTLSRNAEKAFTLSGNAGYTFNNTSLNNDDSVDLGLNFAMDKKALELSMGTSFSVENAEPVYKFGINLNPTGFLLSNIEKEQKSINEQKELNAVANAVKKYETSVVSQQSALSDLLWEKAKIEENYSLYADLERDTYSWFKKGIVTESTYRESLVNKDSYRIKKIINDIDFLLYNNTTKLLFTRDEELK